MAIIFLPVSYFQVPPSTLFMGSMTVQAPKHTFLHGFQLYPDHALPSAASSLTARSYRRGSLDLD